MSVPTLADLGKWAGAGQKVMDYLQARGILSTGTLAATGKDFEEPLLDGYEASGTKFALEKDDQPIARAVMKYIFNMACEAMLPASANPPSTQAPTTSATTAGTAKAQASDKPPKTLPPNVWTDLVKKYNSVCLAGVPREFPERMLIGSETILARVHWEHTCSKLYSPVELGELLSKCSFTATGEVNMLATRKRKARLEFNEDDALEAAEPEPWEPRSPWSHH